jgi:adenosylcobinamide kinase/adenosylcobinamide-phosphate guanylyltransferase
MIGSGLVLVLGGARSGKSAFAERLAEESGLAPVYIATAEAGDAEMAERIDAHRARRGPSWRTVEAPEKLEEALLREAGEGRAVLIDCTTLWLSNLLLKGLPVEIRTEALADTAGRAAGLRILVSNEVGLGIVPENALARKFRDAQGRLNQKIAAAADRVVLIAAGLPLWLKGAPA